YCTAETGLSRGFVHYEDYPLTPGEIVLNASLGRFVTNSPILRQLFGSYEVLNRKSAAIINRDFFSWLSRQEGRPFFAFLNYFDAHEPYLPPPPFATMFGPLPPARRPFIHETNHAWHKDKWAMSAQEAQAERDAYEGGIAYIDQQLGVLFETL